MMKRSRLMALGTTLALLAATALTGGLSYRGAAVRADGGGLAPYRAPLDTLTR
jgi:hypothetical protein